MKKYIKKLNTNKAKTFVLAGLMGLMPSCKMDKNEPEAPQSTNNSYVVPNVLSTNQDIPVDSFMTHMPNAKDAVFYEPTEDAHCFLIHTNNVGSVDTITEIRDMKQGSRGIHNPYSLIRVGNTCINGSANFITPQYYVYYVEYTNEYGGEGNWTIDCVTETEYNKKYATMSKQDMADFAYNRLITQHPEDTYHAEQIRDAILANKGGWTIDQPFNVTFNSNGWQQNLRYSDFGTFDVATIDYSQGFTSMFSGGIHDHEITNTSIIQPQTFKATAYANVTATNRNVGSEQELIVSTGRDSATFTIDALQNETIVMPFKNWYKVTIIRTNNSVVSTFENVNGTTIAETWQLPHPNMQETGYREGIQDNGLAAKDGFAGTEHEDGILTGTSVNYYTDETGYVEFVGQGYRHDWLPNKKVQFWFSFGGTNRPKADENITTGLENVYCAPGRQR